MIRRLAIAVLVLGLLPAALVGVATWQFSNLVTPQIARYLGRHGVESLETSAVQWRFNRLRLERVEAAGTRDGHVFTLRLERVDVGYQWWRLFGGSIDSIAVERAEIDFGLAPAAPQGPPPSLDLSSLLPVAWLGRLPVASLAVGEVEGRVVLPGQRVLRLAGQDWRLGGDALRARVQVRDSALADLVLLLDLASRGAGPMTVGLGLSSGDRLVASGALAVASESDAGMLGLSFRGELAHGGLVKVLDDLRASGASPVAAIPPAWPVSLPALEGETRLVLELRLPARLTGSPTDWLWGGTLEGTVSQRIALASWPDSGLDRAEARLAYRVAASSEGAEITVDGPIQLLGRHAGLGGDFPVPLDEWRHGVPFDLRVTLDGPLLLDARGLALAGATLAGTLGPESQALGLDGTLGAVSVGEQVASATAALTARLSREGRPWLAPRVALAVRLAEGAWLLEGTMGERALTLDGTWRARLGEAGDYRLEVEGRAGSLAPGLALAESLAPLPVAVDLAGGAGKLRYRLEGAPPSVAGRRPPSTQRIDFALSGLTGLVADVALENAGLEGGLVHRRQWQSAGDIRLRIPSAHAGVAIEDIEARLALQPSESLAATRWSVRRLDATLFGGAVRLAEPFAVNFPDPETAFTLVLSNWQLAHIAELYAEHGLAGAGLLSGMLPVRLSAAGVAIEGGELASQQPGGTIAYGGDDVGSGNQQLDMALRLLRNFHYDTLSARADFAPSGDLVLGLRLAGRNPDEFDGRAVNFNINVEENLFDLFKALRLTDEVINRLEKRLRR